MEREFVIHLGTSIMDFSIEELHDLINICGPKTDLRIDLTGDQIWTMFSRSKQYEKALDIEHSRETVTELSEFFKACVIDSQETTKIIAKLLLRTPSLMNVRIYAQ